MSRELFSICLGAGFFCMFLGLTVAATSVHRWSRVVTVVVGGVGCGLALTAVAIAPSVLDRLAGALLFAAVLLGVVVHTLLDQGCRSGGQPTFEPWQYPKMLVIGYPIATGTYGWP